METNILSRPVSRKQSALHQFSFNEMLVHFKAASHILHVCFCSFVGHTGEPRNTVEPM